MKREIIHEKRSISLSSLMRTLMDEMLVAQLLKLSISLTQHGFPLLDQNPSLVSRDSTRFYVSQTFLSLKFQ